MFIATGPAGRFGPLPINNALHGAVCPASGLPFSGHSAQPVWAAGSYGNVPSPLAGRDFMCRQPIRAATWLIACPIIIIFF